MPYNLTFNQGLSAGAVGLCLAITGCSAFIFAPLTSYFMKKIIAKRSVLIFLLSYMTMAALNVFQELYFPSTWLYVFVNFTNIGLYMSCLIALQSFSYAQCPPQFAQQMGVMNQLMANIGVTLGVTLSVAVQQTADGLSKPDIKYDRLSIAVVLLFVVILLIIMCLLTMCMGSFSFERGKWGFNERTMAKTRSFDENLMHPDELVEIKREEDEQKQGLADKYL